MYLISMDKSNVQIFNVVSAVMTLIRYHLFLHYYSTVLTLFKTWIECNNNFFDNCGRSMYPENMKTNRNLKCLSESKETELNWPKIWLKSNSISWFMLLASSSQVAPFCWLNSPLASKWLHLDDCEVASNLIRACLWVRFHLKAQNVITK